MAIEIIKEILMRFALFGVTLLFIIVFYINVGMFMGTFRSKGVPYVGTMNGEITLLKKSLKLKPGKRLVDLGCGDGKALRCLVGSQNLKYGFGYDLNNVAILIGKIINKIKKINNIEIKYGNFTKANLKDFDYIYMYLFPKHMEMYENWVFENMNEEAIVIANTFPFAKHIPYEIIKNNKGADKIYLYKKGGKDLNNNL